MKRRVFKNKIIILLVVAALICSKQEKVYAENTVQDARESVVHILAIAATSREGYDLYWEGSGFFVDNKCQYVVTNGHVVADVSGYLPADTNDLLIIVHYKKTLYLADTVAFEYSPKGGLDLATLKLQNPVPDAKPISLQSAEAVEVTSTVYTMGFPDYSLKGAEEWERQREDYISLLNAMNTANSVNTLFPYHADHFPDTVKDVTVTKGTVSRKTDINQVEMIQIDAISSSGNSGGPLINESGCAIGVNTLASMSETTNANAGYAISSQYIMEMLDALNVVYNVAQSEAKPLPSSADDPTPSNSVPNQAQFEMNDNMINKLNIAAGVILIIGTAAFVFIRKGKSTLAIVVQPSDVEVREGEQAVFRVKATGSRLTYQWQWLPEDNTWQNASEPSASTDTYILIANEQHDGRRVRCKIKDKSKNTVFSNMAVCKLNQNQEGGDLFHRPEALPGVADEGNKDVFKTYKIKTTMTDKTDRRPKESTEDTLFHRPEDL